MEHENKTTDQNNAIDKYKALFLSSRDAVVTLEPPSWKFTSGNPAAIAMFKAKDEADFLRYPPWELSPHLQPDGLESMGKAIEMIDQAMRDGSNLFEWTHQRITGEEFPAEVLLSKVEQDGKAYLHALIRDITERKKLEKQLRDTAEQKFEAIFNSTNDGMLVVESLDKNFILANRAICKMLGYTPEELQKLTVTDVHPKESLSFVVEQFTKQLKGEMDIAKSLPIKRKDGSIFYADVNTSNVMIDGKTYRLGVFRDVSEHKKEEEALQAKLAEIEKLNMFMVGRELKMVELKNEIERLKVKAGEK